MALRFTDTEKWKDEWWQSLSNDYKIIWQYLLDHCDHAGTFKKEFRLMNFECGTRITEDEFNKVFSRRILKSEKYDRWVIVNFCRTQYPKGLESNKPVIVSVRNVLEKYGFLAMIIESFNNDLIIIKDKDKDKDKEMDKDEGIGGVGEKGLVKRETAITKSEPRTPDTIRAYFAEIGAPHEADHFIDYYTSNGWKVGRNAMKDWKATARNWMRRADPKPRDDRRIVRDTKVSDMQRNAAIFENLVNNQNVNTNEND